jgi:hypothetical protein
MQAFTISVNTASTRLTSLDISTRFLTPHFDSTLDGRATSEVRYRQLWDSTFRRLVNNILVFPLYVMPHVKKD